jgi:hypothetical protein
MGPVATKAMKGYSEEDISVGVQEFKVPPYICLIIAGFRYPSLMGTSMILTAIPFSKQNVYILSNNLQNTSNKIMK